MIRVLVTGGKNDGGDGGKRAGESGMDAQIFWQCRMAHHRKPLKRKLFFAAAEGEELAIC